MKVHAYVLTVATCAASVGAVASLAVPTPGHLQLWQLALLGVLIALAEALQIRYRHHGNIDAHNLMEGILAPLVLAGGGFAAVIVCATAIAVGDATRRNPWLKALFNVSQWTLAVSLAELTFHGLNGGNTHSTRALLALIVAVLVMSTANQLLLNGVLYLATGKTMGVEGGSQALLVAATGHVVAIITNLVAAICLAAAYLWSPWTLVAGGVVVVGAYASGRANADVRADGARLAGLRKATHALATSMEASRAIPVFLAEARLGFEVREVQLVLVNPSGTTVHTCDGHGIDDYTVSHDRHELAGLLLPTLTEPTRLACGSGDPDVSQALEDSGHQRALVVPLRSGGESIGLLLFYDRVGMEGFETGELSVATALGRELVGFLERVQLLREIDEERQKLADILESTSDGILSIESDGRVTSWNAGLVAITGYAADEMIGTRHVGLLRPRDAAGRDVHLERWADVDDTASALPAEFQIVTSEGQAVWLSCSYSRIPAAESRREVLVVVARNITQARELERLKDDFVAVVSHELRTPLVPIKGWAQTLLNRGDRLSDDQRRTAVQSILAQSQKLESLVLNILEASRIEAGRSDGDGLADVGGIAMRIVDDTLAARPDRTVRLRPAPVPCEVKGTAVWVERAISNLLANAVKYSPDDEPVDVAIELAGANVLVSITDRGPGIAADAHERIFERFERLEETRQQTGTGLGLYITRRLARAMGGDVTVSSMPGAGSTFVLRLPIAPVLPTRFPEPRQVRREPPRVVPEPTEPNVVNLR